jgi:autotransporter-associated beta strand protein
MVLSTRIHALCLAGVLGLFQLAGAATTINPGSTFTINDGNTTRVGTLTTWNDTGTLTIHGGGTLQTWPLQNNAVANNAPIVFAGNGGTIALKFNDNDTHFTVNGSISSTATGAQTLAVYTGYSGNGDREAVTFYSGIPNAGDGSPMSLQVTYRTQTGQPSYVSLPGVNTFTGPLTLVKGSSVTNSYLTIGGVFWSNFNGSANTPGTGNLGGGNYPGNISLDTTTILNYLSSANQTLSGAISGAGRLVVGGGGTVTLSGASTFSGNTTVSSGSALVLANGGDYTFHVTDGTTNKITGGGSATLNGSFSVDTSAVTVTSGSWTLVDVASKSFGGTFGLAGFTGPAGNVYTKTSGGQSWTFNKATGVLNLSSAAIITSFGIPGATGVIDQIAKTISLSVPYTPWGLTGLASLAPTFTLTSGTGNQTSGAVPTPGFATQNTVDYVVTDTATDPDTINTYSVTVTVAPEIATLVIDLGTSPAGTAIEGGAFIGSGPTNLPLAAVPAGSILKSIAVDAVLEATDNGNYASDLSLLLDPTPGTPGGDFSVEITNGTGPLGGAALDLNWPSSAEAGVGTNLVDTKTEADWAAAGAIDLSTTGMFLGNAFGTAPAGGTWSGTITLTYEVGSGVPSDSYSTWATGNEPFAGDANGDGVADGLAFLLGAATPATDATSLLPTVSQSGGNLVMEFDCLATSDRGGSVLNLQYDGDLAAPWTSALVPGAIGNTTVGNVSFVATANGSLIHIVATVDDATEAAAGKLFGRLEGTE